jgi:hypothetical protein
MKGKNKKMETLRQDLVRYCKQIGVVECEIPTLVFYGEEFADVTAESDARHNAMDKRGGRYTHFTGLCDIWSRTILSTLKTGGEVGTIRDGLGLAMAISKKFQSLIREKDLKSCAKIWYTSWCTIDSCI